MADPKILIQCATTQEFEVLRQCWKSNVVEKDKNRRFFKNGQYVIVQSGIGKTYAAATAEWAFQEWKGIHQVIDFGSAGACAPSLKKGDWICAAEILELDLSYMATVVQNRFSYRVKNLEKLKTAACSLPIHFGKLASQDRVCASSEDRIRLYDEHDCAAVAMESAAIAKIAQLHEKACFSVRFITDTCEMDLKSRPAWDIPNQGLLNFFNLIWHLIG